MLRNELLSSVDLTSMSNATTPLNITDRAHINAVLGLLITENTPYILSDEKLAEKIKNLDYDRNISTLEKMILVDALSNLAQLPTGKKLLSMLPKGVTFTVSSDRTIPGVFNKENKVITLGLAASSSNISTFCVVLGHEIRHALQYKYDPSLTGRTSYEFEKMVELDAYLQNRKIRKEYLDHFQDTSEHFQAIKKAFLKRDSDYDQYTNYLKDDATASPETKEKIANTLYAIDVWYGITENYWRNCYNINATRNQGFSVNYQQAEFMSKHLLPLDSYVKQAYIDNMNVGLPVEFFDNQKDCTVIVDGHKLFERQVDAFGASITMFFPNGYPSYQARLDKYDWKQNETYFYEDGLKRSEYQYGGLSSTHRQSYVKYYDTISPSGQQRIREKCDYTQAKYGLVYANDDTGIPIESRTYYDSNRLKTRTILSGPEKGNFTSFHDSPLGNVNYRMKIDENGVGQGYFEKYRNDLQNSLEWTGMQINGLWNGICTRHFPSNNYVKEFLYNMGKEEGQEQTFHTMVEKSSDQTKTTYLRLNGHKVKEVIEDEQSGWTYQNNFDENGTCVEKFKYYYSKNLARHWYCTGDKKGECIVYYDTMPPKIKFRMHVDEKGVGQGYFERYRNDEKNTLELVGNQKDGTFVGAYKRIAPNGKDVTYGEFPVKSSTDTQTQKKENNPQGVTPAQLNVLLQRIEQK